MTDGLAHPVQRRLLDWLDRFKRLDRRHRWLLDTIVPATIVLITVPGMALRENRPDEPAWAVTVAMAALLLPLWWRRRAPFAAFAATVLVLLTEWSLGVWLAADMTLLVVLYAVAVRGSMRAVAWAGGVTVAVLAFAVYVLRPDDERRLAGLALLIGTATAALAIGLTVRTRGAYLAALEDRAARLETERDQRARLAAADERARVAREMHDIVGHHVSVIVGLADGGATLASGRGERAAEPLRLIGETGRQALAELRRVLGVLREGEHDPQLSPQPGIADLDRLLPGVRAAGLPVTYRSEGDLTTLGRGLQLTVYRIVQEALTNTLKHASRGATAEVTVAARDGQVRVRVRDHGAAGHGLVGMRERAALYGGAVTAGPAADGWLVDVVLTAPSGPGLATPAGVSEERTA
jgi:signal transduction histidine kinase